MSLTIYALKGSRKSRKPFDENNVIKCRVELNRTGEDNLVRLSIFEDINQEDSSVLNLPLLYLCLRDTEDFVIDEVNWIEHLLGSMKYPPSLKAIDFMAYSRKHMSFTSMNIIYDYGKYFAYVVDVNSDDNDFIFMIKNDSINTEILKPLPDALVFDTKPEVEMTKVFYTHKSLACMVKYKDLVDPKTFLISFKHPVSDMECFRSHLNGDKTFELNRNLFDMDADTKKGVTLLINPISIGKDNFYYFKTEDNAVKFTIEKNAALYSIKTVLESIDKNNNNSLHDSFREVLTNSLNSNSPNETVVYSCVDFIQNMLS